MREAWDTPELCTQTLPPEASAGLCAASALCWTISCFTTLTGAEPATLHTRQLGLAILLRKHQQGCPPAHMGLHQFHTVHRQCHTVQVRVPSWPVLSREPMCSTGSTS